MANTFNNRNLRFCVINSTFLPHLKKKDTGWVLNDSYLVVEKRREHVYIRWLSLEWFLSGCGGAEGQRIIIELYSHYTTSNTCIRLIIWSTNYKLLSLFLCIMPLQVIYKRSFFFIIWSCCSRFSNYFSLQIAPAAFFVAWARGYTSCYLFI